MKAHIFPGLLAAIAIGGAVLSSPSTDIRAEPVQFAQMAPIDFSALQQQADAALDRLKQSQERLLAMADARAF
jgi:hypothetical protein